MLEVARRWRGFGFAARVTPRPMSIVYYFPPENETYFLSLKASANLRPNIIVDYVIQTDPLNFPINTLRNRAIDNVRTTHFWLTDMDVWPTCFLFAGVSSRRELRRDHAPAAGVLRGPEERGDRSGVPDAASEVQNVRRVHRLVGFSPRSDAAIRRGFRTPKRSWRSASGASSARRSVPASVCTTTTSRSGTT